MLTYITAYYRIRIFGTRYETPLVTLCPCTAPVSVFGNMRMILFEFRETLIWHLNAELLQYVINSRATSLCSSVIPYLLKQRKYREDLHSSFLPCICMNWKPSQGTVLFLSFTSALSRILYLETWSSNAAVLKVCSAHPTGIATRSQGIRGCVSVMATLKLRVWLKIVAELLRLEKWLFTIAVRISN